jgi:hypothetical protein
MRYLLSILTRIQCQVLPWTLRYPGRKISLGLSVGKAGFDRPGSLTDFNRAIEEQAIGADRTGL